MRKGTRGKTRDEPILGSSSFQLHSQNLGLFFCCCCYDSNYRVFAHSLQLRHPSPRHSKWTESQWNEPQWIKLLLIKLLCPNSIVTSISYVCACVCVLVFLTNTNARLSFSPECSLLLVTWSLKSQTSILPSSVLKRFSVTVMLVKQNHWIHYQSALVWSAFLSKQGALWSLEAYYTQQIDR